jgi:hypothetical protein
VAGFRAAFRKLVTRPGRVQRAAADGLAGQRGLIKHRDPEPTVPSTGSTSPGATISSTSPTAISSSGTRAGGLAAQLLKAVGLRPFDAIRIVVDSGYVNVSDG